METKEITYSNKTFDDFNKSFEDFIKVYYPNTYTDFSEASVGRIFMDLASMVGDNLSFYQDYQFNETLLQSVKERKNIFALAYQFGYKPKISSPSIAKIKIYQQVPSKLVSGSYVPDTDYAIIIQPESVISSLTLGQSFYIKDLVDFNVSNTIDSRKDQVYSSDVTLNPIYYLLEKTAIAISGTINIKTFDITSPSKYLTLDLVDDNIIEILSIIDSDGNKWYEVDNLAQDTIFEESRNIFENDPNSYIDNSSTPYILNLKKVPRRFVTRFKQDDLLQLEFGSGISDSSDEIITLNPNNIGINTYDSLTSLNNSYDITNFLNTSTYGVAPKNTTLTVRYLVGGGLASNIEANSITNIASIDILQNILLDATILTYVKDSIGITNPEPSRGGKGADTIDEIRLNSLSAYTSQNRLVDTTDYITRCLSMPSKYGSISKIFVEPVSNCINLYTLGYDKNKNVTALSLASKENLKNYLEKYKMLNDAIQIKDSFVVNFDVFYEIIVLPSYNSNEVLLNCNKSLIEYFSIDKWQINQPIILSDIYSNLSQIKGVQNIHNIFLENLSGNNYSTMSYDFISATRNNIIYPSKDVMIFEVKFPLIDIRGRVTTF